MNIPTQQIQFVVGLACYVAVLVVALFKGNLELAAGMAGGLVVVEGARFSLKRATYISGDSAEK